MSKHKRQYSERLSEALQYAAELHATQKRKGKMGAPYLAHLLGVTSMVLEAGGTEEQAIAAVLHDAIEDRGRNGKTGQEIIQKFGMRVYSIIIELTHQPYDGFTPQNELTDAYCKHLWGMSDDAILVAAADKIYNAESVVNDIKRVGMAAFDVFKGGRDSVIYKYTKIGNTLLEIASKKEFGQLGTLAANVLIASSYMYNYVNSTTAAAEPRSES